MNFLEGRAAAGVAVLFEIAVKPGGWLVVVDLHPAGPLLQLPQQLFCAFVRGQKTAIALLEDNIPEQLQQIGFTTVEQSVLAGAALQRITARVPR